MSESKTHLKPIHHDDVSPELMAAIEANFPGMKVVCAGDQPADQPLPADVQEMLDELEKRHKESIVNGTCIDCGAQMPNYTPEEFDKDDWKPAKGWSWFTDGESEDRHIVAWQCPKCDATEDKKEVVLP